MLTWWSLTGMARWWTPPRASLAIQQACSDIGVAIPAAEDARWVIGLGLQDALSRVAPNLSVDQQHQLTERFRHHYLSRYEQLQMFPGMWELLHGLQSSGMPLAVATGKTRVGLDRSFELTQTRHLFATSRCADESEPKPAPKMVLEICAELGVSQAQRWSLVIRPMIFSWPARPVPARWRLAMVPMRPRSSSLQNRWAVCSVLTN